MGPKPEEEHLAQFGEFGSGAGQLARPGGLATDPSSGLVYVADTPNQRISVFTPWGNFAKAFGWGVADGTSQELQVCTTTCFQGIPGDAPGQFHFPQGVAVDTAGNVYVSELRRANTQETNRRVQKFNSAGDFLLMFGGEVNKSTGENVCTAAEVDAGDECGKGISGTANAYFDIDSTFGVDGDYIAVDSVNDVIVGDKDRIQRFGADGHYKSQIPLPASGNPGALDVDPSSDDIYFAFSRGGSTPNIFRLDPSTGSVLDQLELEVPTALATGVDGQVYAVNDPPGFGIEEIETRIVGFDSSGSQLFSCCIPEVEPSNPSVLSALATNPVGDLYAITIAPKNELVHVDLYGPPPVKFEPPPPVPPTIAAQYAIAVESHGATLGAEINPHFWDDTTYYLEYGIEDCEVAACAAKPLPPGSKFTSKVVNAPLRSAGVLLEGLKAGTTYHYRFTAQSSGGGPVTGPDRTFRTFPEPESGEAGCPNQAFRIGASASLPDCRAYEMVSPIDKNNGDILTIPDITTFDNGLEQSATGGEALTYSSYRSFGTPQGAPYTNQYLARRGPGGWSTKNLAPPQGPAATFDFETPYKAFSADLSQSWLSLDADPPLAAGAVQDSPTIYRRENDSTPSYEALTTAEEPLAPAPFDSELQGVSADGSHALFLTQGRLTADAAADPKLQQLYLSYAPGRLRLVSVLPSGVANGQSSSAGVTSTSASQSTNGAAVNLDRLVNLSHAISSDGNRVYWTDVNRGPGRIYLRDNADQPSSAIAAGKCSEPDLACTVAVSQTGVKARFWTATPDGSMALFGIADQESGLNGNLYRFDAEAEAPGRQLIAKGVSGVLGASEDLSRIYFVSSETLAGGAPAGKPNLYLFDEGDLVFIATLSAVDLLTDAQGALIPSNLASEPVFHAPRVSPDGRHLAFISTASPTGYDNLDAKTGEPLSEVYLYSADSAELDCASCNPSGARPVGRQVQANGNGGVLAIAASIPLPLNQLYAPRVLSEDGSRLFFNSYDALLPRDTNGKADVYEWERAGAGGCDETDAAFSPTNGGCVYLISSGESPSDSRFLDASPSGSDVFFTTSSSLLGQDPGLIDVYDAREGGGLPAPPTPAPACEGEACQGPFNPPNDPTPASATFQGAGNVVEKPAARKKKKQKKAKKKKQRKAQANHKGRTRR